MLYYSHKFYGIKRKSEFIENNCRLIYDLDCNYDRYHSKIIRLIHNCDYDGIGMELLLEPNMILSLIKEGQEYQKKERTLLAFIGDTLPQLNNIKMFELFSSCLLHFNQITTLSSNTNNNNDNDDNDDNKGDDMVPFMTKYLNWSGCAMTVGPWSIVKSIFSLYIQLIL